MTGSRRTAHLDDDSALLARVARADAKALRALYLRFSARVMGVAARVLGSIAEAEEIVQETFLEVWRRAGQFDPARGAAGSWILAICHNRSIDRLRTRGAAARAHAGDAAEPPPPASPTPLEVAERRQDRERVAEALGALSDDQRLTVELAYFEGLTQREIAERTGQPLGTVKSRVRMALEKLALALGGGS